MTTLTRFTYIALIMMVFSVPNPAGAGPTNPDISVIGDTRAVWSESAEEVDLLLSEIEVAFVGPLNPYASGEVYLGIHGTEGIEVEEAKLLLDRYLPFGFGITAGRYLLDFGQINQVHAHAFPFVDRPLMHAEFFGDDGAVETGARLDWLAPTEAVALRASVGAVRGDVFLGGHHHHEDEEMHEDPFHIEGEHEADPEIGITGRVDLFVEPSKDVSVLVGGSFLRGEHDTHDEAIATWFGVDGKARFDLGPQRVLVVNAEAVFGTLEETEESHEAEPTGWFTAADLRLDKRWNLGAFAESATERLHDEHTTNRFGGFVGFGLMEETTLFRLVGRVTDPEEGDSDTEIILQALFGLGPHKPHRY